MRYQGKVTVHADRKDVWDFVLDVDKFAACMPGVENLKPLDDHTFEGVMRAKVGPVSGEFGFQAQIVDSEAPVRLSAQVEGTDTLTNSTMTADIHTLRASGEANQAQWQLVNPTKPAEELYDVKKDPGQLNNIVADAAFFTIKESLAALLMAELKKTRDPRVNGGGEKFDKYPYYGGTPKFPGFGRKKK